MEQRDFASWVRPIAEVLWRDHRELREFARAMPEDAWRRESVVEGWTCKHILAHLAGGNDQMVQAVLRKVIVREPLDAGILTVDTDAENERRVAERMAWPVARLLDELDAGEEEMQDLLAQLTEDDRDYRGGGFSITLGEFLGAVAEERHDMLHLEQLRKSVSD